MKARARSPRRVLNAAVAAASGAAAFAGIFMMGWILYEIAVRGAAAINWDFFTKLPPPPGGQGGGVANAIYGTVAMTGLAAAVGIPVGLFSGVYLAEFGRHGRAADAIRFVSNVVMGTPSIIIGMFVYAVFVKPFGAFSGYAGAAALAVIMLPVMSRTAEDMLTLVPNELREASLALGAARWRTTTTIVFRASRSGLITGAILAIARVSGETAPLLFTALNSPYWNRTLAGPTGNLTVTIFNFAMSPFANWQQMAWGASLVIIVGVLLMTVTARLLMREK